MNLAKMARKRESNEVEVREMHFKYVVYKLTFPNGKIYVGKDVGGAGHSLRYFGSWAPALVAQDFTKDELLDWSLRKQIRFESGIKAEVEQKERELILALRANDPEIGYNRTP